MRVLVRGQFDAVTVVVVIVGAVASSLFFFSSTVSIGRSESESSYCGCFVMSNTTSVIDAT